jgi:hypothetical protein
MAGRDDNLVVFPIEATVTEREASLYRKLVEEEFPYFNSLVLARQGAVTPSNLEPVLRIVQELGGFERFKLIEAALKEPIPQGE